MTRVETALCRPLAFRAEILSPNRARNCLEHRRGIVARIDCDEGADSLTVAWPRFRVFYVHQGQEVELALPHEMRDAEKGDGFELFGQRSSRSITCDLGGALDFTAEAFAEITFAIWYFAHDMAKTVASSSIIAGLPRPEARSQPSAG